MSVLASVIIPVRNEEQNIEACLAHVAAQDVGAENLQVVVADGRSTDATRAILNDRLPTFGFGQTAWVDNAATGISAGLNRALTEAIAPITVRVDARSRIEPQYVRRMLDVLGDPAIGVAGGAQVPRPACPDLRSACLARALSNRYSTGLSRYRRAAVSGPSDTVWMGAFRTAELRAIGGWDETLPVNEDYELCERYRASGRIIWFVADVRSGYVPRTSMGAVAHQYLVYGKEKGRRWAAGAPIATRQMALLAAPPVAATVMGLLVRRLGVGTTAGIGLGSLLLIDHIGGDDTPIAVPVRIGASVLAVVIGGSWWFGVIKGLGDSMLQAAVASAEDTPRDIGDASDPAAPGRG